MTLYNLFKFMMYNGWKEMGRHGKDLKHRANNKLKFVIILSDTQVNLNEKKRIDKLIHKSHLMM